MVNNISQYLRPLDALRGIAAIGIALFFHYQHFLPDMTQVPFYKIIPILIQGGWVLVELFFLLSGMSFMIFYRERIENGEVSGWNFIVARIARLWPVHMITLLGVTFLQFYRIDLGIGPFTYELTDLYYVFLNVFMIHDWNIYLFPGLNYVSWTVSVEWLMYIVFFILALHRMKIHYYLLMIFIGFFICKFGDTNFLFLNVHIARGFVGFFYGCLLGEFIRKYIDIKKNYYILNISLLIFLIIVTLLIQRFGHEVLARGGYISFFYVFCIFPSIIFLCTNIKFISKFLMYRPFQFLGKISYSLWLLTS